MPTNRDVADFFELRSGFQGMADFASAALQFMDRNGIAMRAVTPRQSNGNGNGHKDPAAMREHVKRHYTTGRKIGRPRKVPAETPFAEGSITEPPARTAPQKKKTHAQLKIEGRQHSADVLAALDPVEPRPVQDRAIGALVRRGYARKKGDGYVRTAKEFVVNPNAPAAPASSDSNGDQAMTVNEVAKKLKLSDSYVRVLINKKLLAAHEEMRTPLGRTAPKPMMVVTRDEVARYQANLT